jgi:hypothetical protein
MSLKSVLALLETKAIRRYIQGRNKLPGWQNRAEVESWYVYQSNTYYLGDDNYWWKQGFNTVLYDTRGGWTPLPATSNTTVAGGPPESNTYLIKETGLFLINASMRFDTVAANAMVKMRLMSQYGEIVRLKEERVSAAGPLQFNSTALIRATAGDRLRIEMVSEPGNDTVTGGVAYTFFSGVRLN